MTWIDDDAAHDARQELALAIWQGKEIRNLRAYVYVVTKHNAMRERKRWQREHEALAAHLRWQETNALPERFIRGRQPRRSRAAVEANRVRARERKRRERAQAQEERHAA